ncbi:MAG TPA: class I SAM-dependent methyltransferase [Actinophytocola sp.]|uniref:class I SAM-dependent methyltransferase n=1 Tax=Actinophytocola sp. TaxID=1872138 RepID=UPI002DDD84FC|nr:class I SAM-dependent methyltransferase [Actinophytocola sp.]HEV2778335.1 class I SAM-dependent methyltransferase [Actinophytocola sp.]
MTADNRVAGEPYEAYVGRWSRPVAEELVRWLDVPPGRRWLDVGCGTGALTATVLAVADPAEVAGVDQSEGLLATARNRVADPRATFHTGDARTLPWPDNGFDAVVSGLVPARPLRNSLRSSRSSEWCGYRGDCGWVPSRSPEVPLVGPRTGLDRKDLRERPRAALPSNSDGPVPLTARAWAVRGTVTR